MQYGFLMKSSGIQKPLLARLLECEEFTSELKPIVDSHATITDATLYEVVKKLYFPILNTLSQEGFKETCKREQRMEQYRVLRQKAYLYRRAIKCLSSQLFGDSSKWEEDFDKTFLSSK